MANTAAWIAGAGQGLTYGTLINSTDANGMTNGQTVLSTIADITNATALDLYMDISYAMLIASSTIVAGANFAFWLYYLNQDGTHYGDNQLTTPGTPATITPAFAPAATLGIPAVAATTTMYGTATGIIIVPGSFRVAMQNNCGFTLSGTQTVQYRTYKLNLNA